MLVQNSSKEKARKDFVSLYLTCNLMTWSLFRKQEGLEESFQVIVSHNLERRFSSKRPLPMSCQVFFTLRKLQDRTG
jgi:hypothetical protein